MSERKPITPPRDPVLKRLREERTREFAGLGPLAGLAAAISMLDGFDFRTLRALVEKYGVREVRDALDKIEVAREPRT